MALFILCSRILFMGEHLICLTILQLNESCTFDLLTFFHCFLQFLAVIEFMVRTILAHMCTIACIAKKVCARQSGLDADWNAPWFRAEKFNRTVESADSMASIKRNWLVTQQMCTRMCKKLFATINLSARSPIGLFKTSMQFANSSLALWWKLRVAFFADSSAFFMPTTFLLQG